MTSHRERFRAESELALKVELRERFTDIFGLSDDCNEQAVALAWSLSTTKNKRQLVIGLFFARCLSHFQAAQLLAEAGMAVESLSLSRGLMETVFVMLAIAEEAISPAELAGHDRASRAKHANAILRASYPNVEPYREILADFVDESSGTATIDMREFARRGRALAAYDGIYRHLSHEVAHPSLSSVDDYLTISPQGEPRAQFKPLLDKTPAALLSASAGILLACFACERVGIGGSDVSAGVTSLWTQYEKLYELHRPWSASD